MNFDKKPVYPKQDLTGKYFSDWYVQSFAGRVKGNAIYNTKCKCGSESLVMACDLKLRKSKRCRSCGNLERYRKSPNKAVGPDSPNWKGTKVIPKAQFTKIQYSATTRDILFEITIDDLQELWEEQKGKCVYSGRTLFFNNKSFKTKSKKGKAFNFASLDRIDSNKGYIKGNIQWVTQNVNLAKQSYFKEEFLDLIKDIYNHMKLNNH